MKWKNNLDSVYVTRKSKTLGEAITCDIADAFSDYAGAVESVRREHDRLVEIVSVLVDEILTDEQKMRLGQKLGYKPAQEE